MTRNIMMLSFLLLILLCFTYAEALAKVPNSIHLNSNKSTKEYSSIRLKDNKSLELSKSIQPKSNGIGNFGAIAIAALVVQNSALTICMRITRKAGDATQLYIPTTAVVISESVKLLVSFVYYIYSECDMDVRKASTSLLAEVRDNWREILYGKH